MRSLLKIALLAVAGFLASCTFSEYPFGKVLPDGGVSSIPSGYTGNAYFWNGSYYTGGRYETGRYHYIDQFRFRKLADGMGAPMSSLASLNHHAEVRGVRVVNPFLA